MQKLLAIFISLFLLEACQKHAVNENNQRPIDRNGKPVIVLESSFTEDVEEDEKLVFKEVLIYVYETKTVKEEYWYFINQKKKLILYYPNDDMIEAVLSYPDGTYKVFYTDYENNHQKSYVAYRFNEVTQQNTFQESDFLKIIHQNKTIKQNDLFIKNLNYKTLQLSYQKTNEKDLVTITEDIPINSYQLYGFCFFEGDIKPSFDFNLITKLNQKQLVIDYQSQYGNWKLVNYGYNYFEIDTKAYKENKK